MKIKITMNYYFSSIVLRKLDGHVALVTRRERAARHHRLSPT